MDRQGGGDRSPMQSLPTLFYRHSLHRILCQEFGGINAITSKSWLQPVDIGCSELTIWTLNIEPLAARHGYAVIGVR